MIFVSIKKWVMAHWFTRFTFKLFCVLLLSYLSFVLVNFALSTWRITLPPYMVGDPEKFIAYYDGIQIQGVAIAFGTWLVWRTLIKLYNWKFSVATFSSLRIWQSVFVWTIFLGLALRFYYILYCFGFFDEVLTQFVPNRMYMALVPSIVYAILFRFITSFFFVHECRNFRVKNPLPWMFWLL